MGERKKRGREGGRECERERVGQGEEERESKRQWFDKERKTKRVGKGDRKRMRERERVSKRGSVVQVVGVKE